MTTEQRQATALRKLLNSAPLSSAQIDIIHEGLGREQDKIDAIKDAGWREDAPYTLSGPRRWTNGMLRLDTDAAYRIIVKAKAEREVEVHGWRPLGFDNWMSPDPKDRKDYTLKEAHDKMAALNQGYQDFLSGKMDRERENNKIDAIKAAGWHEVPVPGASGRNWFSNTVRVLCNTDAAYEMVMKDKSALEHSAMVRQEVEIHSYGWRPAGLGGWMSPDLWDHKTYPLKEAHAKMLTDRRKLYMSLETAHDALHEHKVSAVRKAGFKESLHPNGWSKGLVLMLTLDQAYSLL